MRIYGMLLRTMMAYERYWRQYRRRVMPVNWQARQALADMQEVSANPYVDVADLKALQRAAYFGGHHGGHGGHGGHGHHRRRRRRGHPWRRRRRFYPMALPAFTDNLAYTLQNLANRINRLWARLPNKRRWMQTRQVPYRRTPARLFRRFPPPMGGLNRDDCWVDDLTTY